MAKAKEPAKRGQPTKYRPEYCDKVIAWGKKGWSLEDICSELGVVYNTLTGSWPRANPAFAEALDLWYIHALSYWEKKVEANLENRDFQTHLFTRAMAARFPKKWRESKTTELTGKDGAALGAPEVDIDDLDDAELRLIAKLRLRDKPADPPKLN